MTRSRLFGAAILWLTATAAFAPIAYLLGVSRGGEILDAGPRAGLSDEASIGQASAKSAGFSVVPQATRNSVVPRRLGVDSGRKDQKRASGPAKKVADHGGPLREATVAAIAHEARDSGEEGSVFPASGERAAAAPAGVYQLSGAGNDGAAIAGAGTSGAPFGTFSNLPASLIAGPIGTAPIELVTPAPGALPLLLTGILMFGFAARSRPRPPSSLDF